MDEHANEPHRLDDINRKLYSKTLRPRLTRRGVFSDKGNNVSHEWKTETHSTDTPANVDSKIPTSFFKKFFFFSGIVLLLAILFAGYMFIRGAKNVSGENIEINVIGNTFTGGGEELALQVEIVNKNRVPLELADLLIEYPKGAGEGGEMVHSRISLGTVGGGESKISPFTVTLFGQEGSSQNINFTLEYHIEDSNAVFIKEASHSITLSSAPLVVTVDAPLDVAPNQSVTFEVTIKQNSEATVSNLGLQIEYPFGFKFESAVPTAIQGNNIWQLGDLSQGVEKTVKITGTLLGEKGEQKSLRFYVGEVDPANLTKLSVIYSSTIATIAIEEPFIDAEIFYAGARGDTFIVNGGKEIEAQINWENNLPIKMNNVQIVATFSGNAYDPKEVQADGAYFDSNTNELIWYEKTDPTLKVVEPGRSDSFRFTFTPKPLASGAEVISEPTIKIDVSIRGNQSIDGNIPETVEKVSSTVFHMNTELALSGRTFYTTSPFVNSGPIPPKAGVATTYTITWNVTNSASSATDATVKATLPLYVTWKNIFSPTNETVLYNENTREVSWRLGTVNKGVGYTTSPREVSFQVELLPSATQAGNIPELVGKPVLTGTDSFTGTYLQSTWGALTTRLTGEAGTTESQWKIIP